MKIVKLRKQDLNRHPIDFLLLLGAGNVASRTVLPDLVYVSKADAKKLKESLKKGILKLNRGISREGLKRALEWEWLNYGPNESLAEAIRPGHVLLDNEDIRLSLKKHKDRV